MFFLFLSPSPGGVTYVNLVLEISPMTFCGMGVMLHKCQECSMRFSRAPDVMGPFLSFFLLPKAVKWG